jgi:hypothetical protein
VQQILRPLLVPLLRRNPEEISRRARRFDIERAEGRELVGGVGRSFLDGYNAMLEAPDLDDVRRRSEAVAVHFRPFFFEGAAMGYLPRGWYRPECRPERAQADLLGMHAGFLYLYFVGLGFWYGFRHPRRPERLLDLEPHVDPMYFPLCFDGFAFKLAFFDFSRDRRAARRLKRVPPAYRHAAAQGFGRGCFFVFLDNDAGFRRVREACPEEFRSDLELGRSLARGFTGIDRAEELLPPVRRVQSADERAARLTGLTWALAARRMNDPAYFERCVERAPAADRALLTELPALCEAAQAGAASYFDWQERTRQRVVGRFGATA